MEETEVTYLEEDLKYLDAEPMPTSGDDIACCGCVLGIIFVLIVLKLIF